MPRSKVYPSSAPSQHEEQWDWERVRGLKEDLTRIGREIENARKRKGKTLQQISAMISGQHPSGSAITPSQLSKIERGQVNPRLGDLKLLSLALEMDFQDLLGQASRPWFVVRKSQTDRWFKDIQSGERSD